MTLAAAPAFSDAIFDGLEREFPPGGFARGELDVLQLRRSGIDDLQIDTAGIARRDVGAQQPLGCSHLHLERPRDGDFECQFRGGGIGDGTHGDFIGSGLGIGRGRNFDGDILAGIRIDLRRGRPAYSWA